MFQVVYRYNSTKQYRVVCRKYGKAIRIANHLRVTGHKDVTITKR